METYKRYQPSACPHLGTFEDPETHFSFSTASNYCYHSSPPEMIDLTHQEVYCLSDEYNICPKFLHELLDPAAEPAALPTESPDSPLPDPTQDEGDSGSILTESSAVVEDSSTHPEGESHLEFSELQDSPQPADQQSKPESHSTKTQTPTPALAGSVDP